MVDGILELKSKCHIAEEIGREYQLNVKEIECLIETGKTDGLCSKTLSESIHLSPSRGSRVINRLIDRGLLESTACRNDKRFNELCLTDEGRICLSSLEVKKAECELAILGALNYNERATVEAGINLLLKVI